MSAPSVPRVPRSVDFDCEDILQMPVELLRETIQRTFMPNTDGGDLMARILRVLSGVLLSSPPSPERSQRAVEFLEMAEALDGLEATPEQRAA